MADIINVKDLREEDVRILEHWVERLRARAKREKEFVKATQQQKKTPDFATWILGVKGKLSREEIYDYL
ncbi:hypothetical protein [Desulforhabdus sp. TSK]|uniref:hypothetical protein n=1 Tax=Desulforhabdus sp. TSK TaxID=2925014 RepID=UPI001FC7FC70|nr:hypothetical protein [Desulforhabdus sp. TSK]GKT10740.1 hypothetical protein DSTSK_40450 [Desulforhabdus sp. TSK]